MAGKTDKTVKAEKTVKAVKADKPIKAAKIPKPDKAVKAEKLVVADKPGAAAKTVKTVKTGKAPSRRLSKSLRKHNRRLKEAARHPDPAQKQSQQPARKPKAPSDES